MATYKGVKGFTIQTIAGDPPAPAQGQVWYNTTSNVLKGYATVAGAWASGTALNTPRNGSGGAGVSQDSSLCFGGTDGAAPFNDLVEIYDGSTWTEVNDLNSARYSLAGLGTVTAAMAIGGYTTGTLPLAVETYDGTSWSVDTNLPLGRINIVQGGTTSAAVIGGGQAPPIWTYLDNTLIWNGSTWTEVADMVTAGWADGAGFGTSTAAIAAGGAATPSATIVATTELWDGTSWTVVNSLHTARATSSGCGSTTAGLVVGGAAAYPSPPPAAFYAVTEEYDGTSWTEVANLATGRYDQGQGPNCPNTNSVIWGGSASGSPYSNIVEEWTSGAAVVTFTSS